MLPVIASRKELQMDSEGATESRRHCAAVADLRSREAEKAGPQSTVLNVPRGYWVPGTRDGH